GGRRRRIASDVRADAAFRGRRSGDLRTAGDRDIGGGVAACSVGRALAAISANGQHGAADDTALIGLGVLCRSSKVSVAEPLPARPPGPPKPSPPSPPSAVSLRPRVPPWVMPVTASSSTALAPAPPLAPPSPSPPLPPVT